MLSSSAASGDPSPGAGGGGALARPAGPDGSESPGGPVGLEPGETGLDAPGLDEVPVLAWPLIFRDRVRGRVGRSPRYPWLVLVAALSGLFTVGLSFTVLSVAVEGIADDLGSTRSIVIWIITGPILAGAVVTPGAGKAADLFGARRVFVVAMTAFAASSVAAAVAPGPGLLIVARLVGAAFGSATGPASIAVINRLFAPGRRAQALGYWSLVAAGAPVLGVVVGGPVVEHLSWRWIFAVQAPLSLLTVVVCVLVFPDTERRRDVRFDVVGSLLLALSAGSLVLALNRGPEPGWGWSSPWVLAGFVAAPALLVAFVAWERRVPDQLVPLHYFRRRNVTFPLVTLATANFAYLGAFFLTPFLLENVLGYSTTRTGLLSIARPLTFAVAGPVAGWVATRTGERANGIAGTSVLLVSLLLFATAVVGGGDAVIVAALVCSGIGMGTIAPAMATAIANAVEDRDLGVASGAEQMLSQLGGVLGTQVMLSVQQVTAGGAGPSSYSWGYGVGAVAAAGALTAATFVRRSTAAGPVRSRPGADAVPARPEEAAEVATSPCV